MSNILIAIAVTVLALVLLSGTASSVLMLIPGHFILSLLYRVVKVPDRVKSFDVDGSLSIIVGGIFWIVLFGIGYRVYDHYLGWAA